MQALGSRTSGSLESQQNRAASLDAKAGEREHRHARKHAQDKIQDRHGQLAKQAVGELQHDPVPGQQGVEQRVRAAAGTQAATNRQASGARR
eukprot:14097901-Alexandrium_andersonii.AAC.1